jgi:predicted RNA-binding Zn ribbon-like protein
VTEPVSVEFANTRHAVRGEIIDGIADRSQLDAWLTGHGSRLGVRPPRRPAVGEFRQLRDAIRALFDAATTGHAPPRDALALVNVASAGGQVHPELRWGRADAPEAVIRSDAGTATADALAALARDAIAILGGPLRERLRRCGRPGCVLFFVKDHPRREWCSNACGNRVRAARHYRRRQRQPR